MKDSYSASIELKNFIENVVEQDELNALYEKFSLITLIPKDVLMNKCKNMLFNLCINTTQIIFRLIN